MQYFVLFHMLSYELLYRIFSHAYLENLFHRKFLSTLYTCTRTVRYIIYPQKHMKTNIHASQLSFSTLDIDIHLLGESPF